MRKPPCIEDAYWNGADEMPPNEGEGAIQEEAPMHRRCILEWGGRNAAERLCPCVENAYCNGTIDLPPSVNEGALPIR